MYHFASAAHDSAIVRGSVKQFRILYGYEWKKLLGQRWLLPFLLLCCLLLVGVTAAQWVGQGYYYRYDGETGRLDRSSMPYGEVERLRKSYLDQLSGQVLDESLFQDLAQNYTDSEAGTSQWNLNDYSPFLYLNVQENLSAVHGETFYEELRAGILENIQRKNTTEAEQIYWEQQLEKLQPLSLGYAGGWQALANQCRLLCLVTVLLVTVGLCRVGSEEHHCGTDALIQSSKNGKTTGFWAKWTAGVSFAAAVAVLLAGLQVGTVGVLYGLEGFYTPLQLWVPGSVSALPWSIGEFVAVLFLLLLLAAGMTGGFVMLASEVLRSAVLAMLIPFTLSLVTVLGLFRGMGRWGTQLISYLPLCRVSTDTLEDYYLVTFGGVSLHGIQMSVILYLLLAVVCGVLHGWWQGGVRNIGKHF